MVSGEEEERLFGSLLYMYVVWKGCDLPYLIYSVIETIFRKDSLKTQKYPLSQIK
jgi:hypothetical protein